VPSPAEDPSAENGGCSPIRDAVDRQADYQDDTRALQQSALARVLAIEVQHLPLLTRPIKSAKLHCRPLLARLARFRDKANQPSGPAFDPGCASKHAGCPQGEEPFPRFRDRTEIRVRSRLPAS
jgi:hypothetical protein